jgi:hypothetical protein
VRHGKNHMRLQALDRAPPQQPTLSVVKPEGRPAASVKPGQESCVRSSGTVTLSARGPSDSWGGKALLMINHVGVTNVADNANRRIPVSHKYPRGGFEPVTLVAGSKQVSPLDQ